MENKSRGQSIRAAFLKLGVNVTVLCASLLMLGQIGRAQQTADESEMLREDVSTLKKDVNSLERKLQNVLNQLNQTKGSLRVGAGGQLPASVTSVSVRGETFRGDSGARVALIEYADFECPYCGEYERKTFPQLLSDYIETGKVKYYYRDLPLSIHGRALPAARAARCAGEQGKYWEMHDSLFAKQNALSAPALLDRAQTLGLDKEKFTECLASDRFNEDIRKNTSDAQKYGIDGTPTFFIGTIEGDVVNIKAGIKGSSPLEVFKTDLDALLPTNGQESVSTH
jgi:protein-disulfide isomerase